MLKVLNPAIHGVLDYALALAFLVAPTLLGFPDMAANLSYIIGVLYLGTSLLTKYPLGLLKLIPFPIHGVAESVMAAAWIALPWLANFANHPGARNFFVVAGAGLLLVVVLTDYKSTGARIYRGDERRQRMVDRRARAQPVRNDRRRSVGDRRVYAGA